jgi:ribosomal protein S18 acetylase RimI-like enzyme
MSTHPVNVATARDRDRVVSALVMAFSRDPMVRWTFRDPHRYLSDFPGFVMAFGGKAFEHDAAYETGDCSAAALWLPPGVTPDDEALGAIVERSVAPPRTATVEKILAEMTRYHPKEPCWYLPLIGVDPAQQGQGHGGALLARALERVDREHAVAYLESSNPVNVPLYRRHGFDVIGTIEIDGAPPLIPMLRRAR